MHSYFALKILSKLLEAVLHIRQIKRPIISVRALCACTVCVYCERVLWACTVSVDCKRMLWAYAVCVYCARVLCACTAVRENLFVLQNMKKIARWICSCTIFLNLWSFFSSSIELALLIFIAYPKEQTAAKDEESYYGLLALLHKNFESKQSWTSKYRKSLSK